MPRPVPNDVAPLLKKHGGFVENLALYLHKGVKPNPEEGGFPSRDLPSRFPPLERLHDRPDLMKRVQEEYDALVAAHPTLRTRRLRRRVDWRMAIGLGRASVYENSITLHHIYGIPYVPGSSVKGCVRSYVLLQAYWSEDLMGMDPDKAGSELEARGLADPLFCRLFGCPKKKSYYDEARRGHLRFFDAYPTEVPIVERDILNPHYRDYYMDQEPPTDDQEPTPIYFLTLRETGFHFWLGEDTTAPAPADIVGAEDSPFYNATPRDKRASLLDVATHWLQRTLTEYGLGAKTAVGYGYFAPAPDDGDVVEGMSVESEDADESTGLPDGVEPLAEVSKDTTNIPAQITTYVPGEDQAKVRLYVDGYAEKEIVCNGMSTSACDEGDFIYVRTSTYQMNRVFAVRFQKTINR